MAGFENFVVASGVGALCERIVAASEMVACNRSYMKPCNKNKSSVRQNTIFVSLVHDGWWARLPGVVLDILVWWALVA